MSVYKATVIWEKWKLQVAVFTWAIVFASQLFTSCHGFRAATMSQMNDNQAWGSIILQCNIILLLCFLSITITSWRQSNILQLLLHINLYIFPLQLFAFDYIFWSAYYATYFNFLFSTVVLNNNSLSLIIYSDSRISSKYTPQHASQYHRDSRTHFVLSL